MRSSGKWVALAGMAVGYVLLHVIYRPDSTLSLFIGFTLLLIGVWLWQRPESRWSAPKRSA
jgi:uncharacterized membrane protein YfcA